MIIRYLHFTFTLQADEEIILPAYKGSALRGGFGSIFKKIVCVTKKESCSNCILKAQCAYSYVFETSPPGGTDLMAMGKYEAIPRPFVIEPPEDARRSYRDGEEINFNLILIGRAIHYLPYFIIVFDEFGRMGIGKYKGKFHLKEIHNRKRLIYSEKEKNLKLIDPEVIEIPEEFALSEEFSHEMDLTVDFFTPVRIKHQRDLVADLEFHVLIRSILRRLCLLSYFHGEMKEPAWKQKEIIEAAKEVRIKRKSLRWYDWERYSGRQKTKMMLGGLVGQISYEGKIGPFLPFLRATEIFHVGKGTAFGLGKYRILNGRQATIES